MAIHFIDLEPDEILYDSQGKEKVLFRIMSWENLLKTLRSKSLWFSAPSVWNDPLETQFLDSQYNAQPCAWQGKVFCMSLSYTTPSEAQWRIYTNRKRSAQCMIRTRSLIDFLQQHTQEYDIYIGKVRYIPAVDFKCSMIKNDPILQKYPLNSNDLLARLLLLKRNAFKYENELRVILVAHETPAQGEKGIKLKYQSPHIELIHQILLGPTFDNTSFTKAKELLETKFGYTPPQKSWRVTQSKLYKKINPFNF